MAIVVSIAALLAVLVLTPSLTFAETTNSLSRSVRLKVVFPRELVLSQLPNANFSTRGVAITSISLIDPDMDVTSSDNILAYRPSFADAHGSNLGAIFLNLQSLFPCTNAVATNPMICSLATREQDGFNQGRALLAAQDRQFKVFGSDVLTLGIAVQGCSELDSNCLPDDYSFAATCQMSPSCTA